MELRFWLIGESKPYCWTLHHQESVCFIEQNQLLNWQRIWRRMNAQVTIGEKTFKTFMGEVAVPIYSASYSTQRHWIRQGRPLGLKIWEEDINPADRYLMERFLFGSLTLDENKPKPSRSKPQLRALSIDIETQWYDRGTLPDLYSVALVGDDFHQVFVVDAGQASQQVLDHENAIWVDSITECLHRTIFAIQAFNPDCIIGWNVVDFDLYILQQHCDHTGIVFGIGREGLAPRWRTQADQTDRHYIEVEGRQVVDGPGAFRSAAWFFDDFSLETVSQSVLKRGKKIEHSDDRVNEIERLYRSDVNSFVHYNLEDARLVFDLFEQAGLWQFLIERSHLTGLPMDRAGGSSAAFNTVYMPRLHRSGYIAPSVGEQQLHMHSPGGFVMESVPGLYHHVLVLDFKSLYPSIIRTFLIDPLGLHRGLAADTDSTVPGFLEARFHRDNPILPALIDQLWAARDLAKSEKNAPLSQAIKIIMNSFYGVLGSHLCRFFDPRLASSITMRGHEILLKTRGYIEAQGYSVIYGDTDSLFVHADKHDDPVQLGHCLASTLNTWWKDTIQSEFELPSYLEIEFEMHYEQFVMPTIRGTEKGSKKRYAGWVAEEDGHRLVFKGLEAIRSDWTSLSKQFQESLYRCVFEGRDYRPLIRETVQRLKAGKVDDQLVYKKRLRRGLDHYQKQQPPHVQAARLKKQLLPTWSGRTIEYVKTLQGWQPLPFVTAELDYDHYIEKQLAPIADALLHFFKDDFYSLIDDQMNLF